MSLSLSLSLLPIYSLFSAQDVETIPISGNRGDGGRAEQLAEQVLRRARILHCLPHCLCPHMRLPLLQVSGKLFRIYNQTVGECFSIFRCAT